MKITINIDYREKRIIDHLTGRLAKQPIQHVTMATPNLEVGDIHLLAIGDLDQVQSHIIIERKTLADMVASVKDGRYKEQKLRLETTCSNLPHPARYAYMLEGPQHTIHHELPQLMGAWISSQFRDNIPVIRTVSVEETCDFIMRLVDRMFKNFAELFPTAKGSSSDSSYGNIKTVTLTDTNSETTGQNAEVPAGNVRTVQVGSGGYLEAAVGGIKTKKKDNLTPALCQQLMVCTIPGISSALAVPIIQHFGSLAGLVKYLADDTATPDVKIKTISGIQLQTSTGKSRTVGPAAAAKVIEYLSIV